MTELSSVSLETILNASPIGITVFDCDAQLRYVNQIAAQLLGYDSFHQTGMRCGDFFCCINRKTDARGCGFSSKCKSCQLSQAIASVCAVSKDFQTSEGEVELERDNSFVPIWLKYKASGIVVDGQHAAILAFDDISQKKQDENELRKILAELAAIHENAPIAMLLLDRDRRVRKVNGFAAKFGNRPADSMIGMHGGEALRCLNHLNDSGGCGAGEHCSECKVRLAVLETFASKQNQAEIEAWLPFDKIDADEDRCLLINTAYIAFNDSELVLLCAQDITDRKRFEAALQESETKFRLAFDSSPDAVNINRMDGTYVEISQGFTRMTGYTRDEVVGKTSKEIDIWCIPSDREKLVNGLKEKGYYENLESTFRIKDGTLKTALMSARILPINEEQHILSITRDISERVAAEQMRIKLEKQLQQAQKMESVGRLAGGVAHDLNNMLGPILGYGEMLLEDLAETDPRYEAAKEIVHAGNRAGAIIRQLLAFSRKQTLEVKHIDLNRLLRDFKKLLQRILREDIHIKMVLENSLPQIEGDIGQLEQVVMNLAINAQDAMPDGGELLFETRVVNLDESHARKHQVDVSGYHVQLTVTDQGYGMDKETREQIFEPFFTTKEKDKGTGLGLASVYGIVKQHRGFIWVHSEPGLGTTFEVNLPVAHQVGPLAGRVAEEDEISGVTGTILLVEDEDSLRNMTKILLERNGFYVLSASNGQEAIDLSNTFNEDIDLLLTDVIMPGMDGRQLALEICKRRPETKVLYMSGYPENIISKRGVLLEDTKLLRKPFSRKAILQKIHQALGNMA